MPYQVSTNADGSYQALVTGADAQPYLWYDAYYSASGQMSGYWLAKTDGTYTADTFDYDNSKTYSLLQVEIDSNGRATSAYTNNHDGTHTSAVFDVAGTQSYASFFATLSASGQTESVLFQNDDGTAGSVAYDYLGDQTWTTFTADYVAGGTLRDVSRVDDDGTRAYVQYDYDGTRSWSTYSSSYDASGAVLREDFANRDGTALAVTHDTHDATFDYTFDTIAVLTNAQGVVVDQAWTEANGAQYNLENVLIDGQIDPGAAPRITIYAPGHVLAMEQSGTRFFNATHYDWNDTQSWSKISVNFLGTETVYGDDGSTSQIYRGQPGYVYFSLNDGFPF